MLIDNAISYRYIGILVNLMTGKHFVLNGYEYSRRIMCSWGVDIGYSKWTVNGEMKKEGFLSCCLYIVVLLTVNIVLRAER